MTSASELFPNLRPRSRVRNPNPNLVVDLGLPSDLHRHRHHRRHRHRCHANDCVPSSRHHRALEAEHELLQQDNNSPNNPRTGNHSSGGTITNHLSSIRNGQRDERLPNTVMQARARLLERLHGISLSENSIIDPRDWEIETPIEGIEFDVHGRNVTKKKPPGLSWEKIRSLTQESFKDVQEKDDILRASVDCCICLERFWESERLLRLPCYHRFHLSCLEPWLRNRGDCPYCRASI